MKKLITSVLAVLVSCSVSYSQDFYDDIYYDSSKEKKVVVKEEKTEYTEDDYVESEEFSGTSYENYGNSGRDVDEYNRRGGMYVQPDSLIADNGETESDVFEYTGRIERFSDPNIVKSSNDEDLKTLYYSGDVNIYVDTPTGYMTVDDLGFALGYTAGLSSSSWWRWNYPYYSPYYGWRYYDPWRYSYSWYDPYWGPGYWYGYHDYYYHHYPYCYPHYYPHYTYTRPVHHQYGAGGRSNYGGVAGYHYGVNNRGNRVGNRLNSTYSGRRPGSTTGSYSGGSSSSSTNRTYSGYRGSDNKSVNSSTSNRNNGSSVNTNRTNRTERTSGVRSTTRTTTRNSSYDSNRSSSNSYRGSSSGSRSTSGGGRGSFGGGGGSHRSSGGRR